MTDKSIDKMNLDPKKKEDKVKRSKEAIKKAAKSLGKPFTITIKDGKDVTVLDAISARNGEALLKQHGIAIYHSTIRSYLTGKMKINYVQSKKTQYKKVIFKYTEEFLEDQKDLPGEIWRTEEEWDLAEEIIECFEKKNENKKDNIQDHVPPKAISNFGRIETHMGKRRYVSDEPNGIYRFKNTSIKCLVGLAFNDYLENDPNRQGYTKKTPFARYLTDHDLIKNGIDVKKKYRIDKEGRKVNSNHIDTLEFCNKFGNIQYYSNEIQKAQQDPMNEFRVTPLRKDLPKFNRTFHSVPEFFEFVEEQKIDTKFNNGNVRNALKGKRNSASGYKFTYVIPRVETQ